MVKSFLKHLGVVVTSLALTTNIFGAFCSAAAKYDVIIEDGKPVYVYNDGSMIPDKYNTGVNPNIPLTKVTYGADLDINGLHFNNRSDMGDGYMLIDPINATIPENGIIVIENYDFSDLFIRFVDYRHFSEKGGKIKLIFKNCKFYSFSSGNGPSLSAEFYDCEFNSVNGSYLKFERCKFHPTDGDAMIPMREFYVKDCYIYTLGQKSSEGKHIDGFQSFGNKNFDSENIYFSNTRIEVPKIKTGTEGDWYVPYINAPAMISNEYSPYIRNVVLEDMHLNGGGYSIYYGCSKDCVAMTDLTFKNVQVGYGHMFGTTYPTHGRTDEASIASATENTSHVESIYVGSVWKSSDGVHMSVTNEMLDERTMICKTNTSATTRTIIPAHPKLTQRMNVADIPTFDQLPYDIDVVVADMNATTVDCYDATNNENLASATLVKTANFKPVITDAPVADNAKPATETKSTAKTETKAEPKTEAKIETKAEPKPTTGTKAETKPTAETKPATETKTEAKPTAEAKPVATEQIAEVKTESKSTKPASLPNKLPDTGADNNIAFAIGAGATTTLLGYLTIFWLSSAKKQ